MNTKLMKTTLLMFALFGTGIFINNISAKSNADFCNNYDLPQVDTTGNLIHIPMWIEKDVIMVTAEIDGISRTFVLDSGAPCLILNSIHFKSQIDPSQARTAAIGIDETVGELNEALVSTFNFQGICMDNQYMPAVDLSHVEKELNMEIYGLIGFDIYYDYDMLLDYQNRMITLINPDMTIEYLEKNYKDSQLEINAIEMQHHIPTVVGTISGQSLKLGIDTGISSNILNVRALPLVRDRYSVKGTSRYYSANNVQNTEIGVIDNLMIGNKEFLDTITIINNLDQRLSAYNIQLDGFIGSPILSLQKTLLRYNDKQLIFIN